MSLLDRLRSAFLFGAEPPSTADAAPDETRGASRTEALVAGGRTSSVGAIERRGARSLRKFSEQNTFVRTAINRRKREIGKARWRIIRIDDEKAQPDPKLVNRVVELFRFVNTKRESFRSLLDMLVEDILVLDAGCCEKIKNARGDILELRAVDGATIAPLGDWDGKDQKAPRYVQAIQSRVVAEFTNDDLLYIMANPRTNSNIGLSPLETLFDVVEAELYQQDFEFRLMRETAPAGVLYLGSGVPADKVQAFREEWEANIAGTRDIVFLGGGGVDPLTGATGSPPQWTAFTRSAREDMRREFAHWLALKIASVFEMDLMAFNLSETVTKANGGTMQAKTDDGLTGLATLIAEFITREIMWELDPTHRHGFEFMDLNPRDTLSDVKVEQIEMSMGIWTPNELRAKRGLDPFPDDPEATWADLPYPFNQNTAAPAEEEPMDAEDDPAAAGSTKPQDDSDDSNDGDDKKGAK